MVVHERRHFHDNHDYLDFSPARPAKKKEIKPLA